MLHNLSEKNEKNVAKIILWIENYITSNSNIEYFNCSNIVIIRATSNYHKIKLINNSNNEAWLITIFLID